MIADCETCDRKQVPCSSCQTSQRAICFICQGDEADPYGELLECLDASDICRAVDLYRDPHRNKGDERTLADFFEEARTATGSAEGNMTDHLTAAITLLREGLRGMAPDERMRWKVRVEAFINRDQHTPQLNQPYR